MVAKVRSGAIVLENIHCIFYIAYKIVLRLLSNLSSMLVARLDLLFA